MAVDKLAALIERFIPEIKAAFLAAIQDVISHASEQAIIEAIENGDLEAAFRALGFSPAAMRPITAMIERAFETGGVTTAETFPMFNTMFRFDVRNSRAEAWIRDRSSRFVSRVTEDVRVAIRNVMTDGLTNGRNPRDTALDLIGRYNRTTRRREGGVIGLTAQFERAVQRARQELATLDPAYFRRERRDERFDRTVWKAINSKTPLTTDVINKLVGRYSDSLLQLRGENISRTETMAALHRSEYEAIKQAVDEGKVKASTVKRIWDNAGDNRVRHSHNLMEGQTVGLDEPFVTPPNSDGNVSRLMFPCDTSLGADASETINCRCRARLKIDWLSELKNDPEARPRAKFAATPVETKLQRNVRLNAEMKSHVVNNGLATGVEHLWSYDDDTGEKLQQGIGQKSFVAFTPDLARAIADANRNIIAHHNHPSSSSFSSADLHALHDFHGLKGLFAHGHNGNSYYAERGEKALTKQAYKNQHTFVESEFRNKVTKDNVEAVNKLFYHTLNQRLKNIGYIKYDVQLSTETQGLLETMKDLFEEITKKGLN